MPWQQRKNTSYYVRRKRQGGRIVEEYLGSGPLGLICAVLDAEDREEREERRRELAAERQAADDERRRLDRWLLVSRLEADAWLAILGYRRHQRGELRRKRGFIVNDDDDDDGQGGDDEACHRSLAMGVTNHRWGATETCKHIRRLGRDVQRVGNANGSLGTLEKILATDPAAIVRALGGQSRETVALAELTHFEDSPISELIDLAAIEARTIELAGDGASPLVSILARRVAVAEFSAWSADEKAARKLKRGGDAKDLGFWVTHADRMARRLERACRALAEVRQIETPTLQQVQARILDESRRHAVEAAGVEQRALTCP